MTTVLGSKRSCAHCSSRFYDLNKQPPVCPKCGKTYQVAAKANPQRKRRKAVDRFMDGGDLLTQHMAAMQSGNKKSEREETFEALDKATEEPVEELGRMPKPVTYNPV